MEKHDLNRFKPGDKVRIVKKVELADGWRNGWDPEMDKHIGGTFTVKESIEKGVYFEEAWQGFPSCALEEAYMITEKMALKKNRCPDCGERVVGPAGNQRCDACDITWDEATSEAAEFFKDKKEVEPLPEPKPTPAPKPAKKKRKRLPIVPPKTKGGKNVCTHLKFLLQCYAKMHISLLSGDAELCCDRCESTVTIIG